MSSTLCMRWGEEAEGRSQVNNWALDAQEEKISIYFNFKCMPIKGKALFWMTTLYIFLIQEPGDEKVQEKCGL